MNKGITRIVFYIGNYAIKIAHPFNNHCHFLYGCYANNNERRYCRMVKGVENNKFYNLVAPSLYCSLFGVFQIQRRCIVNTVELTKSELRKFKDLHGGDTKPNNFGFLDGKLVCLDYP